MKAYAECPLDGFFCLCSATLCSRLQLSLNAASCFSRIAT